MLNLETRQWLLEIVESPKLGAKTAAPPTVINSFSGSKSLNFLDKPARPLRLELSSERQVFPRNFESERARGEALHFFANHELLAIEIMAAVALKFPNLPLPMLKGLVTTIGEEQSHLSLYIKRMNELGIEFGEFPLNSFFWDHAKNIESLEQYLALMPMTFEQANLDFANYYARQFSSSKDLESAKILEQVRDDEIGHVKFGLYWFDKLRAKSQSLFKEYMSCLNFPMTPERAKGKGFSKELRLKAGLTEDYIDELHLFSFSKGRAPHVFYFNPSAEIEFQTDFSKPDAFLLDFQYDLEDSLLFLAQRDDLVLLRKKPSEEFLESILKIRGFLPEIAEAPTSGDFKDNYPPAEFRKFQSFQPWGWSPSSLKFFKKSEGQLAPQNSRLLDLETLKKLHSKLWAQKTFRDLQRFAPDICADEEDLGCVVHNQDDFTRELLRIKERGFSFAAVKGPYGMSGRNSHRFAIDQDSDKMPKVKFPALIEPWLDLKADLSIQIHNGRLTGYSRFMTNGFGSYKGAVVRPTFDGIPPEVVRALTSKDSITKFVDPIIKTVTEMGYTGPMGIDGFLYKSIDGRLLYKPISEINMRWNFGSLNLVFQKLIAPGHTATWKILKKSEVELTKVSKGSQSLAPGEYLTTDITKAKRFVGVLSIKP